MMQKHTLGIGSAALLMLLGGANAHAQSQNISVVVNGQPITFNGTQPQQLDGTVLVPLRGVFEDLGANVDYDQSTHTIFATKNATNVTLILGSQTATVNGQDQSLSQPPQVMLGTTLVPLRFVAEALGAYVEWNDQTSTVNIESGSTIHQVPMASEQSFRDYPGMTTVTGRLGHIDNPGDPTQVTINTDNGSIQANIDDRTRVARVRDGGEPVPSDVTTLHEGERVTAKLASDGDARYIEINSIPGLNPGPNDVDLTSIHGRIVGLDSDDDPSLLTVQTGSGSTQVNITQHTTIAQNRTDADSRPADPRDLRIGDDITAQLRPDGNADSIRINAVDHHGTIVTVLSLPDDGQAVVLDNGQTVHINSDAVIMRDHQQVQHDLHSGDVVTIRTRSDGGNAYEVDLF